MRPDLPLEVLGLVGPILAWTEGSQSQAIPMNWTGERAPRSTEEGSELTEPSSAASTQEQGWLLNELATFSLDNVDEVVDYSRNDGQRGRGPDRWRPPRSRMTPPPGYDLRRIFEKLASRYLIWNGGKVAIRTGRMVELHELGLRMPLGFIVRHIHARAVAAGEQRLRDVASLPEAISLLPSNSHTLRTVVRRGLSEGHLHLNSVHATEVAWADHLLKPLRVRPANFGVVEWRQLRLSRAAVRLLALATALVRAEENLERLGDGIGSDIWPKLHQFFDAMYFAPTEESMQFYEECWRRTFQEVVASILDLRQADRWLDLQARSRRGLVPSTQRRLGLLHWLDPHRMTHHWHSTDVQDAYNPLSSPVEREEALSKLHLAAHLALVEVPRMPSKLSSDSERHRQSAVAPRATYSTPGGRFLHQTLFRYLICQTHHWQLGVQQGRTTGLRHFKKYYESNQRRPIRPTERENANAVLRRVRDWRGLRVLEGRIGPPRHSRDLLPWLTAYATPYSGDRVEKFGLVIHFIKNLESSPSKDVFRARFAKRRSEYRQQAFRLFRILERPTLVTPFIVGIDAANLELASPPEIFAPVFRFLRDRPIALRDVEGADITSWRAHGAIQKVVERRRLGMTYHVGEEFRHLLSGLRAIDEVLEFLAPRSGDRIGHGIALGLDPQVWLEHVGRQALVPQQEWLDTLVWTHQLLGAGHNALGRLRVEEKIEHLGRELYLCEDDTSSRSVTPLLFRDVWLLRQLDPEMFELDTGGQIHPRPMAGDDSATWRWNRTQRRMLNEVRARVGENAPTDLLSRYWFSPSTRAKGAKLILIDMEKDIDLWLEVCQEAQKLMQHRIAREQIAVEVNPSANRVIGPMSRYADHHIFNLTFAKKNTWQKWLRVTVNTDNPGTANTCLTHEFYLLGEALVSSGFAETEVEAWLEWLRQSGNDSSFVRQLPSPSSRAMTRLTKKLGEIQSPLRDIRDPNELVRALWKRLPKSRQQTCGRSDSDVTRRGASGVNR